MATVHPPPPPPPPPSGKQPPTARPPPCPGYAAVPFNSTQSPPVQETGGPPEPPQEASAPSPPTEQNGPQSPPSQAQEGNMGDDEEKWHPVQETQPVPQEIHIIEADEVVAQEDEAGENQLP